MKSIRIDNLERRVAAYAESIGKTLRRTDESDPEDFGLHVLESKTRIEAIDIESFAREHGLMSPYEHLMEWY